MSKLRKDENPASFSMEDPQARKREFWSKVGLTAVSALLGGVAVALFNRKTLQSIQQKLKHTPPPPSNDDIY